MLDADFTVQDQVIQISWTDPKSDCKIISYDLLWIENILWSGEDDNSTDFKTSNFPEDGSFTHDFTDTNPYSSYNICISAKVDDDNVGEPRWTDRLLQTDETGKDVMILFICKPIYLNTKFNMLLTEYKFVLNIQSQEPHGAFPSSLRQKTQFKFSGRSLKL